MREMVLYYNPVQTPHVAKLKGVLVQMGVRIKNISPEQVGQAGGRFIIFMRRLRRSMRR